MKKCTYLLLIIMALVSACSSDPYSKPRAYVVDGNIEMWDSGWVYLQFREEGKYITIDSIMSVDGKFQFKNKITYPKLAYLKLQGINRPLPFFLDAGNIRISASPAKLADALINGSMSHHIYQNYLDESKVFSDRSQELYKVYEEAEQHGDSEKQSAIIKDVEEVQKQELEHLIGFVNANPKSVVSAHLTLRNLYRIELPDAEAITANLDPTLAGSEYVIQLKQRLDVLHSVQIGKTAPDFAMNDSTGNPLSLSSLRGKYLLVDFWAAWCGPCRAENPNVVAAYQKYYEKGFDVLGVSLDTDRARWIEAIHKDQLKWHHVSDLQGWANTAAKQYAVNAIPANVLLDPEGVIIARNLREKALHEKLEELLGGEMVKK